MRRPPITTSALTLALAAPAPAAALSEARDARIELTTYATLYGAGLGLWTATELDLNARPAAWLTAGLAGGALWGTWEAAQAADLQPNQAALISAAAGWTLVDTLLINAAIDGDGERGLWMAFGTSAAAAGLAYALAPGDEPSAGDISLINSGGLWMPIGLTLAAIPAIDAIADNPPLWLLVTSGLGLVGGGLLSRYYAPTREQVLYLDAGLGVGLMGGGLLGVIGGVLTESIEVGALITLACMVTGGFVAAELVGLDGDTGVEPTGDEARPLRRSRPLPTPVPLWVGAW